MKAIVEAAARILEDDGFERYTTNAIAQRAGISIGSLYQYFPGKDAITSALIARESRMLVEKVDLAMTMDGWQDAMRCMIRAAVQHQLQRPRLARLLDFEEQRLSASAINLPARRRIQSALVSLLQTIPDADFDDTDVLAGDILAMTRALTDAAGDRAEIDQNRLEGRVTRAVFGYIEWQEDRQSAEGRTK